MMGAVFFFGGADGLIMIINVFFKRSGKTTAHNICSKRTRSGKVEKN